MGHASSTELTAELRKLEGDWKSHPFEKDVFCHSKSKMQVHKYLIVPTEKEKKFFLKRARQHHAHILQVVHCEPIILTQTGGWKQEGMIIFMQKMLKMMKKDWKQTQTALSILKGFRRLSSTFGFMKVTKGMIGISCQGETKLWVHEIPIVSEPEFYVESEVKMLEGLAKIIIENDPETGILLAGAASFNEAINNILLDLSRKSLNTTNRHKFSSQIKHSGMSKGNKGMLQNKKMFSDKSVMLSSKRLIKNEDKSKKNFPPFADKNTKNYCDLQITDYPQTKLKHTFQSQKHIISPYFPPSEAKQLPYNDEIKKLSKEKVISHQRKRHSSNDLSDEQKVFQVFNRFQTQHFDKISYPYPSNYEQKNDLKKISIKKLGKRKCSFEIEKKEKRIENSILQEDEEEDSPKVSDTVQEKKGFSANQCKKGQNIFTMESLKNVPQTNHSTMEKTQIFNQSNGQKDTQTDEDRSFEEKRQLKQEFNKKIRFEMKNILDLGDEKEKVDEKSMKDVWIRQKINKKKQNFAQLKKEALKLLKEQFSV